MEIKEKVIEILNGLSSEENIEEAHLLQTDLALDSLAMVTMLLEIEEVFGIELEEADMNPFDLTSVSDVIRLVEKYCEVPYEKEA